MLRKLLKHEFRATGRIMLPILAAIILLSIMAGVSTRILDNPNYPAIMDTVGILVMCVYFCTMFAAGVVALVLMIERFEKNLLGSEGYLMMTLPVSVDQHILSKLIVSVVWFACAVLVFGTMLFMLMAADFDIAVNIITGFNNLGEPLSTAFNHIGSGSTAAGVAHVVGYGIEFILFAAIGTAAMCLRFYCAMAIGYSFNNHKRLFSVIAFFAIEFVLNTIGTGIISLLSNETGFGIFDRLYNLIANSIFSNVEAAASVHLLAACLIIYSLISAAIYYLPTRYFLKNRLNLA